MPEISTLWKENIFAKEKIEIWKARDLTGKKKKMNFSLIPSDVLKIPVVHTLDTEVH